MTMTLTASTIFESISFVFLSLTDTDLVRWSFIHFVTRLSTRPFAS
jgi:hypothetical protein